MHKEGEAEYYLVLAAQKGTENETTGDEDKDEEREFKGHIWRVRLTVTSSSLLEEGKFLLNAGDLLDWGSHVLLEWHCGYT